MALSVTVKLFAQYREGRPAVSQQTLPEGAVIRDVILGLGIDEESLPLGIILVNGRLPDDDTKAKSDEEGIPILLTPLPVFELTGRLYEAGIGKNGE